MLLNPHGESNSVGEGISRCSPCLAVMLCGSKSPFRVGPVTTYKDVQHKINCDVHRTKSICLMQLLMSGTVVWFLSQTVSLALPSPVRFPAAFHPEVLGSTVTVS